MGIRIQKEREGISGTEKHRIYRIKSKSFRKCGFDGIPKLKTQILFETLKNRYIEQFNFISKVFCLMLDVFNVYM